MDVQVEIRRRERYATDLAVLHLAGDGHTGSPAVGIGVNAPGQVPVDVQVLVGHFQQAAHVAPVHIHRPLEQLLVKVKGGLQGVVPAGLLLERALEGVHMAALALEGQGQPGKFHLIDQHGIRAQNTLELGLAVRTGDAAAEVHLTGQVHILFQPGQAQQVDISGIDADVQIAIAGHGPAEPGLTGQGLCLEVLQVQHGAVVAVIPIHFVHQEFVHRAIIRMHMTLETGIGQRALHSEGVGQVAGDRPGRVEEAAEGFQPYPGGKELQIQYRLLPGQVHTSVQDVTALGQVHFHVAEPGHSILPAHDPMGLLDGLTQDLRILQGEGAHGLGIVHGPAEYQMERKGSFPLLACGCQERVDGQLCQIHIGGKSPILQASAPHQSTALRGIRRDPLHGHMAAVQHSIHCNILQGQVPPAKSQIAGNGLHLQMAVLNGADGIQGPVQGHTAQTRHKSTHIHSF